MSADVINKQGNTLVDDVEKLLFDYIREHGILPGDIFPKEEVLAASLRVSRPIIRESLNRLKALGLIEVKRRRGTMLCRPNAFIALNRIALAGLFTTSEERQLMEMRVAMELGMCDFIFYRMRPEQLLHLKKLASAKGGGKTFNAEVEFHSCLMECAGNEIASQFRGIIVRAFKPIFERKNRLGLNTATHSEIVEVLTDGTVEEFRQVMRRHFAHLLPQRMQ